MSYTLVVVDMQATFEAANNARVRNKVKQELSKAMERGAAIIFVEYIGQGPTIPSLVKMTDDYNRVYITRKDDDDGSREVKKVIKDNRLPSRDVRVCGVNTDCCVMETVFGISEKIKSVKIKVIAEACNSDYNHKGGLQEMKRVSRIVYPKKAKI